MFLTIDEQDNDYEYDYENRIVKITDGNGTIAEYAYDALGRRIRKIADSQTRLYYYNNNNQVLLATDTAGDTNELNVFGNYLDEIVYSPGRFYIHDHLYSVVAITNLSGTV
ncbi:MAG: RHS repeat protein [Planctomycetes bacterium]|nr:RHS repeat protein [Planctomycetota bacterium]